MASRLRAGGWWRRSFGYTLTELLVALALFAIVSGMTVPSVRLAVDRGRAVGATRYLVGRMAVARVQAVMRSANVALRFRATTAGVTFQLVEDGDGDGVRIVDISAGIDRPLDAPTRLAALFPGVEIAVIPEVGGEAVRVGSSGLLSFSPLSTATPGSIFIRGRDGSQFAIRVLGATARTRVERYVPRTRTWIDGF